MNGDANVSINIMQIYHNQSTINIYLQKHNMIHQNTELIIIKYYFAFIIK